MLLVIAAIGKKALRLDLRTMGQVSLLGLTQTSLQYVFFYTGLAYATGVKSSIMNATGTFFSMLLAHGIYKNDRLSFNKALGCIVGFVGVMVVNFSPGLLTFDFKLQGEGFVVMAAFVLSAASIYGKRVSQHVDSVVLTGYQLAIGADWLHAEIDRPAGLRGGAVVRRFCALDYLAEIQPGQHGDGLQLHDPGVRHCAVGAVSGRENSGVEERCRAGAGVCRYLAGHAGRKAGTGHRLKLQTGICR